MVLRIIKNIINQLLKSIWCHFLYSVFKVRNRGQGSGVRGQVKCRSTSCVLLPVSCYLHCLSSYQTIETKITKKGFLISTLRSLSLCGRDFSLTDSVSFDKAPCFFICSFQLLFLASERPQAALTSDPCNGDKQIRTADPLLARQVLSQLSYTPEMGLSGLEPPTSRLSGVRSNRLSYKPDFLFKAWGFVFNWIRQPPILPGSLPPSTVGRKRLNCHVRNGYECFPFAQHHRKVHLDIKLWKLEVGS